MNAVAIAAARDSPTSSLRPWQRKLRLHLIERPHPSSILWCYDSKGDSGKSFMSAYLAAVEDAIVFRSCETHDDTREYGGQRIAVFDLDRRQGRCVNYEVLKGIKDGQVIGSERFSKAKFFQFVPHVVVLADFPPDERAGSENDWHLVEIVGEGRDFRTDLSR